MPRGGIGKDTNHRIQDTDRVKRCREGEKEKRKKYTEDTRGAERENGGRG